ncbi:AI-2E family transporter [Methanolapillus millepedarum]|uniref:AI-2E family transporter n=1 Tax=Methanolapillus millepedarum TaxID=3028296 RepID=A0AA96VFV7_9EURY|nr:hypothetical protein MsAc7_13960 [Methanosarcinaceae archaeon Ac7]
MELSVNKKVWQYMFIVFVLLVLMVSFVFYLRVVFIALVIGLLAIIFIERLLKIFNKMTVNYTKNQQKVMIAGILIVTFLTMGALVVSQAAYFSDYFNSFTESLDELNADYNTTAGDIAENLTNISVVEFVPGIDDNTTNPNATGENNTPPPPASNTTNTSANNTTVSNATANNVSGNNTTGNSSIQPFNFSFTWRDLIRSMLVSGSGILTMAKSSISMMISIIFATLLVIPIMTGFYFKRKGYIGDKIVSYAPDQYKDGVAKTIKKILKDLDTYMSMKILEAIIISFLYCIGFYIAGLPHWLISGVLMGIFNTAPYIGFVIPALPIVVYSYNFGMNTMLAVIGIIIVIQLFDYFFIMPNVVTSNIGIKVSSFTSVILALAGLKLFGVFGLIFAMPLYIFCKIILTSCYEQLVVLYPDPVDPNDPEEIAPSVLAPPEEKAAV